MILNRGNIVINYLTVKEIGDKWNVSGRMVTIYCNQGKIDGAVKKGNLWLVPIDAEKPLDGRTIQAKKHENLKDR